MLYVHQVCQGCCTYIRCVRDVVCTSGVSGMLYVHQVCQGCCMYIRCVRDVMDGLYIMAYDSWKNTHHVHHIQHIHTGLHTLSRSALWIPLLITVTLFICGMFIHVQYSRYSLAHKVHCWIPLTKCCYIKHFYSTNHS